MDYDRCDITYYRHAQISIAGVSVGLSAVHPLTGAEIPVYVADYVIGGYGTKAVMGVPAHDDRDLLFAQEHNLSVVKVIEGNNGGEGGREDINGGVLVNSNQFNGMSIKQARREIASHASAQGVGGHMTQYKLRDWLISRQRYWGAPIPILNCNKCGVSLNVQYDHNVHPASIRSDT